MPVNIVFDTNVWVSYFINARADYLIKLILSHDMKVFTSEALTEELDEVLRRPKFKLPFPVPDYVALHQSVCVKIKPTIRFTESPDPDDNFLFELCIKANANYLVTSDKKLLQFIPPFDLNIVTFNEVRSLLG